MAGCSPESSRKKTSNDPVSGDQTQKSEVARVQDLPGAIKSHHLMSAYFGPSTTQGRLRAAGT